MLLGDKRAPLPSEEESKLGIYVSSEYSLLPPDAETGTVAAGGGTQANPEAKDDNQDNGRMKKQRQTPPPSSDMEAASSAVSSMELDPESSAGTKRTSVRLVSLS